ncbi:MAG: MotA/TolQ/ExbB proton channel family protein [Selenomonadales bacterium]|nr:MotA/TolQ/ExbB proton channel family protein [Selenomonadales bacterium]
MEGYGILDWFVKGGIVMYPLLFCSLLVVAIAVERFCYYQKDAKEGRRVCHEMMKYVDRKEWKKAGEICMESESAAGRILASGISAYGDVHVMRDSFEDRTSLEAARLKKNLGYLDTVVTMAPLLGLLGTVVGMIGSFNILDAAAHPTALTGGIGEALIATASGLCVAVLALCVHSYFARRLDNVLTEMETMCMFVIDRAKGEVR